jgi:hypothetical protein
VEFSEVSFPRDDSSRIHRRWLWYWRGGFIPRAAASPFQVARWYSLGPPLPLALFTEVRGTEILGSSHSPGSMQSDVLMYGTEGFCGVA